MAQIITEGMKAVGIAVEPIALDVPGIIQRGYIESGFDLVMNSYALGPDPDVGTERLYNSNNILAAPYVNNAAYANPEVDKLFDEQRLTTTFEARKAIYDRIQELIWADVPCFPLCAYNIPSVFNSNYVTNVFNGYNMILEDFATATPVEA
jgi:peptide/nickel transport system substrate-binding protein